MPTDLPVIPCYKSDNCKTSFQCGSNFCDINDPECFQIINGESVPLGYNGICWGYNINECDGVLSCCDPSESQFNCTTNQIDPATNTDGFLMGCKIGEQTEAVGDCAPFPNQTLDICMEFSNNFDTEASECQINCWEAGGRDIIDKECGTKFPTRETCESIPYYCRWNGSSCVAHQNDPFERYNQLYGQNPPTEPITIPVVPDCNAIGLENGEFCIENPSLSPVVDVTVTTSQSAWDSSKRTSYQPRTRIYCVKTCDINTQLCTKKCITTPRCQFVQDTCNCTEREDKFICGKILYRNINTDGGGATVSTGSGYCTWCQNQSENPEDIGGHDLPDGLFEREPTEWSENGVCNNRCENYNLCEVKKFIDPRDGIEKSSEELWNNCIWEESNSSRGVDPQDLEGLTDEEKKIKFREDGFCASTSDSNLIDICENKLQYLGSISGGDTEIPGGNITEKCTYSYEWKHLCQPQIQTSKQWSENYLCTWCPSLQCKQGTKEDICNDSNITNTICTTNDEHGSIINPEKWDENCGCFGESPSPTPSSNSSLSTEVVVAASLGGFAFLCIVGFLFFKYRAKIFKPTTTNNNLGSS